MTSDTLAEQRVGLVEEQDAAHLFGGVEDAFEVLFGLADIFVDDLREVDAEQRQVEFAGDDFRRHGLAGPGNPGEEQRNAAVAEARAVPVVVEPRGTP